MSRLDVIDALDEQWLEEVCDTLAIDYASLGEDQKRHLLSTRQSCPDCNDWLTTAGKCGACGWFEGQDVEDEDDDDGGAFEEARHMAGMGGGNAGLADFGGLDISDGGYDDRFGGDDE